MRGVWWFFQILFWVDIDGGGFCKLRFGAPEVFIFGYSELGSSV